MRRIAIVGTVNVDLIVGPVAPWPQAGTEVTADHSELRVGGSGGNVALALSAMGADYVFPTNVGADRFGDWLRHELAPHSGEWLVTSAPTAISVGITHPDGERTFITTQGHLPELDWQRLRGMLETHDLSGGIMLVCGGYFNDRLNADYLSVFDWARERGMLIALDTGWPMAGWTSDCLGRTRSWLRACDHLLINEVEATSIAGTADLPDAMAQLARLAPRATLVIKTGPRGAEVREPSGEAYNMAAPAVSVIDTIGAGDAFNAGYLMGIAEGQTVRDAVAQGIGVATAAISSYPRRYGVPGR